MKFIAKPVEVEAFVIQRVSRLIDDPNTYCTLDDRGTPREIKADPGMTARYQPVPGDYWVVQADGYEYINPKAVFERKYSQKLIVEETSA